MSNLLSTDSRKGQLIILALWLLAILWVRPWTGDLRSDPLTYACVAKDMAENGNWLSPELDGKPYLNKPPLYFWIVGAFFRLFGPSVYAARLPSLLFATANVFFLYLIVHRQFRDRDLAFFTAFLFATTRWIVRNSATNRPESLLVFSVLLGWFALVLMREKNNKGPYLLGLSFAAGFLTKLFFALFFPLAVLIHGALTRRLPGWLKWPHVYMGAVLGVLIPLAWLTYMESSHPGALSYLVGSQTVERFVEGADVKKDSLMYLREMVLYYQPHVIFLAIGLPLIIRKIREEEFSFIVVAVLVILIPLQLSQGKSDRYLTIATPFLSFVSAMGIMRFARVRNVARKVAAYAVLPLLVVFWTVPLGVHAEKYHVLGTAARLSVSKRGDYRDPFYGLGRKKTEKAGGLTFVDWTPGDPGLEYKNASYFYLPPSFQRWDTERLTEWLRSGEEAIVLLTSSRMAADLPVSDAWIVLDADSTHMLLAGLKSKSQAPLERDGK